MNAYYLIPIALGVTVVLQGTLNKQIGSIYGLSVAVLINAAIFFILSLCFLALSFYTPNLVPDFLRAKPLTSPFQWYYLIPGICGFILVLGLPWAFQSIGAGATFILLISSQLLCGFFVDTYFLGNPVNIQKIGGALLSMIGAVLILFS
ncbi:MAG: hypothetical protein BroJett040_21460 [Oligoflexia bacterium]|nr:MAG: hypothetical protein BroJett040_21460 [Oligoflexia bacterium]